MKKKILKQGTILFSIIFIIHTLYLVVLKGAVDGPSRYFYYYLGLLSGLQILILYKWYIAKKEIEGNGQSD